MCLRTDFTSVAVVPIRYRRAIKGALHLADKQENAISAEMIAFAETNLVSIVGEAVHRFDVEDELRSLSTKISLAEEQARRDLAVALHDSVGQTLALSKIKLGTLGQLVKAPKARRTLGEIREMFEKAVVEARTLSFELSPPILYELGLDAAVEWLAEEFQRRHGVKIKFESIGERTGMDESLRVLFFQSVRELLTNIVKHAKADNVHILLHSDNRQTTMTIQDDGVGFECDDPDDAIIGAKSLGLFSIRERIRHIDGTFSIQSKPRHGTKVTLSVPSATNKT
jgi:signal transduction histidine kinase